MVTDPVPAGAQEAAPAAVAPGARATALRPPWWARFAVGVVAVHAGGFVWALLGLPRHWGFAAATAILVGLGLTWAVRRLWRRRFARVALRVVVATHILFWTGHGLLHAAPREAGEVHAGTATVWTGEPRPFLAGIGEASFRLTDKDVLAGYGGRPRRIAYPWFVPGPIGRASVALMCAADGTGDASVPMLRRGKPGADALGAKAVVLKPASGPKAAPLAICRLDLVFVDARIHAAVVEGVSDLGFTRDTVLLSATHTHSGPGGFTDTPLAEAVGTAAWSKDVFDRVVHAATYAIRAAWKDAVPARIGFVRARDLGPDRRPILAENRAGPERDRVDSEVLGIRLDAADQSRRIALILNYAVHPTWNGAKDDAFSGDVARALEESAEIGSNAPVLFLNGAEGDVGPRIAPEGPGREAAQRALASFAGAVGKHLAPLATRERLRIAAASVERDFGSPRWVAPFAGSPETSIAAADHPFGPGFPGALAGILALPVNAVVWSAGATDARIVGSFSGGAGLAVNVDRWLSHTDFRVSAVRLETPEGTAAIVCVPGETTTAVGERLKAAGRLRGADPVFVFGLTGDHMAYVASPEECAAGGYEARSTLFGPQTATRLEEAVDAALGAVGLAAPGGDGLPEAGPR